MICGNLTERKEAGLTVSPTMGGVIIGCYCHFYNCNFARRAERAGKRSLCCSEKGSWISYILRVCLRLFCIKRRRVQTVQPVGNEASKLGRSVAISGATWNYTKHCSSSRIFPPAISLAWLAGFSSVCLPPCSRERSENTSVFLCKLFSSQQAWLLRCAAEAQRGRWHLFDQGAAAKEQWGC